MNFLIWGLLAIFCKGMSSTFSQTGDCNPLFDTLCIGCSNLNDAGAISFDAGKLVSGSISVLGLAGGKLIILRSVTIFY